MATIEELKAAQADADSKATEAANGFAAVKAPEWYKGTGADTINQIYDAQKDTQLKQLESSYKQSLSDANAAKDKIAPQYQTAANDLAIQYERNRQNFNRQAAASGINTGTSSQAALARQGQYQRDFGKIRTSEAEALTEADRGIADLTTKYQDNIAIAVKENDYKRAAALMDEYNQEYNRLIAKAESMASFGDFSGYVGIYGQDAADNMFYLWAAEHPQLAYNAGRVTRDQYDNLINNRPINDGLDENGVRVVPLPVARSGRGSSGPALADVLATQYQQLANRGAITQAAADKGISQAYKTL